MKLYVRFYVDGKDVVATLSSDDPEYKEVDNPKVVVECPYDIAELRKNGIFCRELIYEKYHKKLVPHRYPKPYSKDEWVKECKAEESLRNKLNLKIIYRTATDEEIAAMSPAQRNAIECGGGYVRHDGNIKDKHFFRPGGQGINYLPKWADEAYKNGNLVMLCTQQIADKHNTNPPNKANCADPFSWSLPARLALQVH